MPEGLAAQRRATLGGPRLEGSGERGGYSPADLRAAYNLPDEGGAGLTIAITIAYDYPKAESDLATYRGTYGLPPCTSESGCFRKVNQEGQAANYPEARSAWAAEAALDLDMTSAICPKCKLLLVEADDNSAESLSAAVGMAAELGPSVISDSWGGREFAEEVTLDHYFSPPGIPVLFASGDSGYSAEYPAASSDVIAVGGTSLHKDEESARGWREAAWVGAGSGCSAFEEKPAWQTDPACAKRGIADVSAVADPRTPVSVYDTYGYEYEGWELFGGTSAAAPILAGVEALSSAADRAKGAELFWEEGPEGKLFDPGEGRNGSCHGEAEYLCDAQLGYDGPTGWGTPGASRPEAPAVATYDPTAVTTTEAMLNGAVNPNDEETSYRFEYGLTRSYGTSVPVLDANAGSGSNPLDVTRHLAGLARNTTYHFRLVAENATGTSYGGDRTFETSLWSVQYMPRKEQNEEMSGVSCPSTSSCVAVGSQGVYYEPPTLYYNDEPLVERWDGGEWRREAVPVLHPPASGYFSVLAAVSCSAPDACMAVGTNYELHLGYEPLGERWDGSEWSIAAMPMPGEAPPNTSNGQREVRMHGVSCTSPASCVAVGQFTKVWDSGSPEEIDTLIERWDGSRWSVVPSPNPPTGKIDILWGVSCTSAASCVAVGESRAAGGSTSTLIERWDGTEWSIDAAASLAGGLQGVSCSSVNACMAVGGSEGRFGGDGVAEVWNGLGWSAVSLDEPMRAVSCLAADWCVAAGGDHSAQAAFAQIWNGERWILEYPVTPVDASDNPKEMYGVSCEPSGCTAVGWYWSWGYQPLAERLDRSLVAPPPSLENDPVASVSKTGATLRAHVDSNGGFGGSDCHFALALKSAPANAIAERPCDPNPVEGDAPLAVEAQVTGLEPSTEYVYRVAASNEGGTSNATPDGEFTTSPNAPSVANEAASAITQTTAVLHGHVDNEGAAGGSSCHFEVALKSSPQSPLLEADCAPNPVSGDGSQEVEATVDGLNPNTSYVVRVVAENEGGKSTATPDVGLATLPNPPLLSTDPASSIDQTTAVLRGQVNNQGAEAGSSCKFAVALASSPQSVLEEPPCRPSPVSGAVSTPVEATATGLGPNTGYVYRILASNAGGSATSAPEGRFATLPNVPMSANDAVGALSETTAVLHGHVDNEGAAGGSSCIFAVALKSAPRTPLLEADCSPNPVTGDSPEAVEASLDALSPNTSYVARVVAENEGGKSTASPDKEFTTLASNAFGIWKANVRCNGRIVFWLEAPGGGGFRARATAVATRHRAPKGTPGSRGHQHGCGELLQRAHAHEPAHFHSQSGPSAGRFFYGAGLSTAHAAGSVRLMIEPGRSALRELRSSGRLRVRVAISFKPEGGAKRTRQLIVIADLPARLGWRGTMEIR